MNLVVLLLAENSRISQGAAVCIHKFISYSKYVLLLLVLLLVTLSSSTAVRILLFYNNNILLKQRVLIRYSCCNNIIIWYIEDSKRRARRRSNNITVDTHRHTSRSCIIMVIKKITSWHSSSQPASQPAISFVLKVIVFLLGCWLLLFKKYYFIFSVNLHTLTSSTLPPSFVPPQQQHLTWLDFFIG